MHFSRATLPLLYAGLALSAEPSLPRTVFEFPKGVWLENIAATRSGKLLTGSIAAVAELHIIDPFAAANASASTVLHTFEANTAVFGISELATDVFAVAVGNYSLTAGPTIYSTAIWTVDLGSAPPAVKKVADLKTAKVPNGIAALNNHAVLVADSLAGNIGRVDLRTGAYSVVLEDAMLTPNPDAALPFGTNGLKINNGVLYTTNSGYGLLVSVPISRETGCATGPFATVAEGLGVADDLAVSDDGTAFVARPFDKVVERITPDGRAVVIAGPGNEQVPGVTAVTLGRTWRDRSVAYVSTGGGNEGENGAGDVIGGGKVVAIAIN